MYKALRSLAHRSRRIRRWSNRYLYQYISRRDKNGEITLMNYGYIDLDPDARPIPVDAEGGEFNRYCLQLYHHVASAIDLRGLDVLEVGSGRGGGAAYAKSHFMPRSMTGVDYSENAVAFCQRHHAGDGLQFLHGDAEDLRFADETFDAVINVESSHCYGEMAQFLGEAYRVLRPAGHLLWADFRTPNQLGLLHADIRESGFEVLKEEDISANVLAAMSLQRARNKDLVDRIMPWYARRALYQFAAVEGTLNVRHKLQLGKMEYWHLVLRKS